MVKKISESTLDLAVDYLLNNKVTFLEVARKFKISTSTLSKTLKNKNIIVDSQRNRKGRSSWNKGLTKHSDARVAGFAKTLSKVHSTHRTKEGGYKTVYDENLKKAVKIHNKVWFENTGHWPDPKLKEQIHHIDNDAKNNNFDNLFLTDVVEHSKIHKEYEQVFVKLLRLGLLKFDKDKRGIDWDSFDLLIKKLNQLP